MGDAYWRTMLENCENDWIKIIGKNSNMIRVYIFSLIKTTEEKLQLKVVDLAKIDGHIWTFPKEGVNNIYSWNITKVSTKQSVVAKPTYKLRMFKLCFNLRCEPWCELLNSFLGSYSNRSIVFQSETDYHHYQ